ncbi:MAG: DUF2555 domain-containing protein [Thermosynechococcus sp.]|uniref:protein IsiD n=1 Tax=Thermosynechococcus sp. TaxID=2814275 RepID=UPI00391C456E
MAVTHHYSREEYINHLTPQDVAALARRLEEDDYDTPFAALEDWHLLRAIAFQRPELAEPYLYLLDLEAFDES